MNAILKNVKLYNFAFSELHNKYVSLQAKQLCKLFVGIVVVGVTYFGGGNMILYVLKGMILIKCITLKDHGNKTINTCA